MVNYNWEEMNDRINKLLRPKLTAVGLKFLEKKEGLEHIPKVRYMDTNGDKKTTVCMLVSQAIYNNWTVAILPEYVHIDYCRALHGMADVDDKFKSGKIFEGAWFCNAQEAAAHNNSVKRAGKKYQAMAASPLSSGRITNPDVCVLHLTPAQMFLALSGYLYSRFEVLDFSFVSESACTEGWLRALITDKPAVTIPSFAERRFGGIPDDQLALCLSPEQLLRMLDGMDSLSKNGLRYPITPFSITNNPLDGMPANYRNF